MVKVLDCTLRDGGYYTNWDFSSDLAAEYLDAMRSLNVDIVEIGYRSPPKTGYLGRYFYLSRDDIESARDRLNDNQKIAIMLNKKDVTVGMIGGLLEDAADVIDIVRFACPPDEITECIELAREVAKLDIQVAVNVMYLHKYIDDPSALGPLVEAGDVVQYVALVDSYGSCYPNQVSDAIRQICQMLPQDIGYHGHDNIGLAFANAIAAIDAGAQIVDTTVTGMGRGAGNLSTELFLTYQSKINANVPDYAKLANLLETFNVMKKEFGWGTNLPYMISGMNGLPQADVMRWLGMRRYSPPSIVSSLLRHNGENIDLEDFPKLTEKAASLEIESDSVILIGGGPSALEHVEGLSKFVEKSGATIVHSSLKHWRLLNGMARQVFCLAGEEVQSVSRENLAEIASGAKCFVVPAAPRFSGSVPQVGEVCEVGVKGDGELGPVSDISPLKLALNAAIDLGAKNIYLFAFDGYANADKAQTEMMKEVQRVLDDAQLRLEGRSIVSLSPTMYSVEQSSIYALPAI